MPQRYESLSIWQRAHQWVLGVYRVTCQFPRSEAFGLVDQLRRSAASVPTNIVEGFGRRGTSDKLRFYNIAEASLNEADYHLRLAHDLGYADTRSLRDEVGDISRMLAAYAARVRSSSSD